MKKILIEASSIAQEQKTGVGYFAEQLSAALESVAAKNDAEISYLWLNPLNRKQPHSALIQNAKQDGRLVQIPTMAQRIYAKLVYLRIAPPIITPSVDWILFPNFYTWPVVGPSKKAVIIHDMCFVRYPEYVEDKNQKFLSRVGLKAIHDADTIIANSEFTKDEIVELTGVSETKILTIDIPVNEADFLPELNRGTKRLQERYGIQKKYILTLGTIEPRKNIPLLVEAYVKLPSNLRSTYSLVIAGKWGWKTDSVKALITKYQAEGYDIVTTSYIDNDDKSTLYRNASAYAISTFYEGFGMPLLEALHCGIPTVATDIPVLREVAGEDACLWSPFDAEVFSHQLQTILTDPELASVLRGKALKRSSTYSWAKTAQKVIDGLN